MNPLQSPLPDKATRNPPPASVIVSKSGIVEAEGEVLFLGILSSSSPLSPCPPQIIFSSVHLNTNSLSLISASRREVMIKALFGQRQLSSVDFGAFRRSLRSQRCFWQSRGRETLLDLRAWGLPAQSVAAYGVTVGVRTREIQNGKPGEVSVNDPRNASGAYLQFEISVSTATA